MQFSFFRILKVSFSLIFVLGASALAADWNRAVASYNHGEYQAALAEFQDMVRERPDAAGPWYYIGLCEFRLKRYKRVEAPMTRALALLEVESPASADIEGAWYTIGFSYFLLGDYEKAIDPLKRYVELASKPGRQVDPSARRALGRAFFYLDRHTDALPLLSASTGAKDKNAQEQTSDFYFVGAIHFRNEKDDLAIAALREAVKAAPTDPAAMDLLAESLMRRARKSGVTADWIEAARVGEHLKTVRDDVRTASVLGRAYLGAKEFEKAVGPLEKLAKAGKDDGQAWLYYGIALSRSGQSRKAMEALEITIQILPDSVPAMSELAYVYESNKQYQQALRIYEKAYAASGSSDASIKQNIERVKVLAAQPQ